MPSCVASTAQSTMGLPSCSESGRRREVPSSTCFQGFGALAPTIFLYPRILMSRRRGPFVGPRTRCVCRLCERTIAKGSSMPSLSRSRPTPLHERSAPRAVIRPAAIDVIDVLDPSREGNCSLQRRIGTSPVGPADASARWRIKFSVTAREV